MSSVIATKIGLMAAKEWKWVIVGITTLLVVVIMGIVGMGTTTKEESNNFGMNELSPEVLTYRPIIEAELSIYGLEELTPILLAILQQESGGNLQRDIFQASESLGLPPNTIADPLYSVQVGVKNFVAIYKKGTAKKVDTETIVQSYNFGSAYIDFISANGGIHSEELAKKFSSQQMKQYPGKYSCGGGTGNSRYPYCFGDWSYTTKVFSYMTPNVAATGSPLGQDAYETLFNEMIKFQGFPYNWGGSTPSTSFDCSGLTSWGFNKIGYHLPRTAQEQYNATKRINKQDLKPGDLVFFKTATYSSVTHVGIYVGNNKMFDANDGGIGFSELSNYWNPKIVGYGRVS